MNREFDAYAEEAPAVNASENSTSSKAWTDRPGITGMVVLLVLSAVVATGCIASSSLAWSRHKAAADSSGEPLIMPTPIELKPTGDNRTYQHAVLANGMRVINVHDADAVTGAYAVAVEAGSWDDPEQLPGLAHFCEHMLFLGTASYPGAEEYDEYVKSKGGYVNAYTAEETTVYFAEMSKDGMSGGLNRFGDFFRAPLFNSEFVLKEVHAIDSEHAKNVQDPAWRLSQLMHSLAAPESPVPRFHTGDLQTLVTIPDEKGLDLVQGLRQYFEAHYCPGKMHLVTFGPEPLLTQFEQAVTFFGNISGESQACRGTKSMSVLATPDPWPDARLGRWVTALGTQPQASLTLFFAVPDIIRDYLSQPVIYLDHVLSNGGERSLKVVMRDHLSLITGMELTMERASPAIIVQFALAERGRRQPELVLDSFFQYMSEVRSMEVDMSLYSSLVNVSRLDWDWGSRTGAADTVKALAERSTRLPAHQILAADSIVQKMDAKKVSSLLEAMQPSHMNAILLDPDAEQHFEGEVLDLPHYGVKHTIAPLDARFPGCIARWESWLKPNGSTQAAGQFLTRFRSSGHTEMDESAIPLPPKAIQNVPARVSTVHMLAKKAEDAQGSAVVFGPTPQVLKNASSLVTELAEAQDVEVSRPAAADSPLSSQTWLRTGWMTTSPVVKLATVIRPWITKDQWEVSAIDNVRMGFYNALANQQMDPRVYDDTVAGLCQKSLAVSSMGISFAFEGLPELLPRLIDGVLNEVGRGVANTSEAMYLRIASQLNESFRSHTEMPITSAIKDRGILLTPGSHALEESLAALTQVNLGSVARAPAELLLGQRLDATSLVMGNIDAFGANNMMSSMQHGITDLRAGSAMGVTSATNQSLEVPRVTPVVDPRRPVELRKLNPRAGDPNDVMVLSLLQGVATVEGRVLYGILGQLLQHVAYTELRTNQQLGYVVNAGTIMLSNVLGMSVVVQGDKLKADEVEAAVEAIYLDAMPKKLEALSEEEFTSWRHSFQQSLTKPPLNSKEEFDHFWSPIGQGGSCFGLRDAMAAYLEESVTSKEALIQAWNGLVFPESGIRKKMAVKYFAESVPPRPTIGEVHMLWAKHKVPEQLSNRSIFSMLEQEYKEAAVLDKADSIERKKLAKAGGFFPQDLHCELQQKEDVAKTLVDASPSSVSDFHVRRKKNTKDASFLGIDMQ